MGPIIDMVSKKFIDCHHVVIDVMSSNISSHHFVIEEPMKELSLEEMFQTMHNNDFNDTSTTKLNNGVIKDVEEVSSEDRQFLQTVEEKTIMASELCVVPLPFLNENLEMTKNRKAMKRLMYKFQEKPIIFC